MIIDSFKNVLRGFSNPAPVADLSSAFRALSWVRNNELATGGIRVHSNHPAAYPEVTGYLIPTLKQLGETDLCKRLINWLICIQRPDGSFTDPDHNIPHVFDTGQILRGLLTVEPQNTRSLGVLRRACEYMNSQLVDHGRGGFLSAYDGAIDECMLLYAIPPYIDAAKLLGLMDMVESGNNAVAFYSKSQGALDISRLTHFLAYEIEALIDLGHADMVLPVLGKLANEQEKNGSVRGVGGAKWVCTPGLAQLAICWYKIGNCTPADLAMEWLDSNQMPSGGFLGSYGNGATYFPESELSWAAKYYLDAHQLRVNNSFHNNAAIFPDLISLDDGRLQFLLEIIKPGHAVLDAGCGKGRFLKALLSKYPDLSCTGLDSTPDFVNSLPREVIAKQAHLESIPCPDNSFDVVFAVESLEHSVNKSVAISEMMRVTKPGGHVVVIDKDPKHWTRMECSAWERWASPDILKSQFSRCCESIQVIPVGYDGKPPSDGLMFACVGQKRSRLSGSEWNKVLISNAAHLEMVTRIKANMIRPWARFISIETTPGDRVLEIGSGTGEISLQMALTGRDITALDCSAESLAFTTNAARELGVSIQTVEADATNPLPFEDDSFDCVWSSGLLEHFFLEERVCMLREWARVCRGKMVHLVPNAACVAYRVGKSLQEIDGTWLYGLEMPLLTLRPDYEAAGLVVDREFSVGARHALSFLPATHPLRESISVWLDSLTDAEIDGANQGYLLVAIGHKR